MKPSIPKGTRDFLPEQVARRNYIFNTIREVFELYGYVPIETPVMENLSTLTGKYGDEGDKLLFKVLNNGDFLKNADPEALADMDSRKLVPSIAKRGLRYDLTVPFARFVTMHQNDIAFPFKRYQIQQVWRGDRPQRGRYQEFFQCDADVVGSDSLMYESELLKIYDTVFSKLGINCTIKLNNRKVLFGLAESQGVQDSFMAMTVAIDKIDKIGKEGVLKEMESRDIPRAKAERILEMLQIKELELLEKEFENSPTGLKGIEELKTCLAYLGSTDTHNEIRFDMSLARGLTYYTGCIIEVQANDYEIGSIGGGGRYDNLTGSFGLDGVSGVGISFGAARIYDVMDGLKLFPESVDRMLQILILAIDDEAHSYAFQFLSKLRERGVSADLYPEPTKIKKQMKYADKINVPHVIIIGSEEMQSGQFTLKNMKSGDQSTMDLEQLIERFS